MLITCDAAYPDLIDDCWAAMKLVLPECRPVVYPMPNRSVRMCAGSRRWVDAFPQHGPGRKHLRPWHRHSVAALDEFIGPKR